MKINFRKMFAATILVVLGAVTSQMVLVAGGVKIAVDSVETEVQDR